MTDDPLRGIGVQVREIDDLQLAWKEMSDLGNAERLVARHGDKLMCVEGRWMGFDGRCWSRDDGERLAIIAAHATARAIRKEADALKAAISGEQFQRSIEAKRLPPDADIKMLQERIEKLCGFAVQSGNSNKINGMLSQAEHLLTVHPDELDRDLYAINVLNGTLRIRRRDNDAIDFTRERTGPPDPHDPADRITKICDAEYDPSARCPKWLKHLETCLPDPQVREFFQQMAGYLLTGSIDEQCIFILQGKGGDGKSTTMDVLRQMMGTYAIAPDVRTFLYSPNKDGAGVSPDRMRFKGDVRLLTTGEPPVGAMFDDSIIKQLTGGQPMAARGLHAEQIEFVPRGKLVIEVNKRPRISGDDDGIWRRIMIVLFPHQFKGAADKRFKYQLLEERSGILNWALEGLRKWQLAGSLVPPEPIREAVEDYRRSANPFGEWMAECLVLEPEAMTPATELYQSYKAWCERNDVSDRDMMTNTAFGRALGDKQILRKKDGKGLIQRRGARLRTQLDDANHDDLAAIYFPEEAK